MVQERLRKAEPALCRALTCLVILWGWPGLISEPELLSLGLEQASWVLALKDLFVEIQVSAIQGEAWVCLRPLMPIPTQKSHPHPQNTSVLAKRGHGDLLTVGFVF